MPTNHLRETRILNYTHPALQRVLHERISRTHTQRQTLKVLYAFVSALPLGYNKNDDIPASEVLRDGYAQCNTKTSLLCALARGAGIPTRVHAYRLHKRVQRARAPAWLVFFMPQTTMFVWPEFFIGKKWVPLQGIVKTKLCPWDSCPFDGAKHQTQPLQPSWIARDLGRWNTPDELYKKHKPTVYGWRTIGWFALGRSVMNKRVRQ
jgi:hypothetical protein